MDSRQGIYSVINTAKLLTDHVIVFASGGKDSVVTLDLCATAFKKVDAFFMYIVPDLEFQQRWIRWAEQRYSITFHQLPHWMIGEFLMTGSFRLPDLSMNSIHVNQIYNHVRQLTGAHWIAAGETISDSIYRRAMIKNTGTIDYKRGRIYPVAGFNREQIRNYIKFKQLRVSEESEYLGFSFRALMAHDLKNIKQVYPEDYEKIRAFYPFVDAELKRAEWFDHEEN